MRKTLLIAVASAACFSLSACSDTAPSAPPTAASAAPAPAASPGNAPAAAGGSTLLPWTDDLAAAGTPNQMCALDLINDAKAVDGRFEISAGQAATLEGWVASTDMQAPPRVSVVLDGASDFQITGVTGVSRDDVAQAYHANNLANSGFKLDVASLAIPAGEYKILIAHQEGGAWVACKSNMVLAVK
jgi:hypothetical protein